MVGLRKTDLPGIRNPERRESAQHLTRPNPSTPPSAVMLHRGGRLLKEAPPPQGVVRASSNEFEVWLPGHRAATKPDSLRCSPPRDLITTCLVALKAVRRHQISGGMLKC